MQTSIFEMVLGQYGQQNTATVQDAVRLLTAPSHVPLYFLTLPAFRRGSLYRKLRMCDVATASKSKRRAVCCWRNRES
jgi:hypothetical protein